MEPRADPKGWIKIYRDIVTKDIYLQDPLYSRVFERLIIEANHACKRIPYKGETKLIKRGEKLTSIRQIAEWVGWYKRGIFKAPNPKTISSILKWMVKNNLIEIYGRGNSQETHYNIVNYCIYQSRFDDGSNGEGNSQVTVDGSVSKQSMGTNNNDKNVKNVKKKNIVYAHPMNYFEQFWNAYPKKKSKGQAEKAWGKYKVDEQFLQIILIAIEQAKKSTEWKKDNGQFIPYPATWLNAKGWEDSIVTQLDISKPLKIDKYEKFYL